MYLSVAPIYIVNSYSPISDDCGKKAAVNRRRDVIIGHGKRESDPFATSCPNRVRALRHAIAICRVYVPLHYKEERQNENLYWLVQCLQILEGSSMSCRIQSVCLFMATSKERIQKTRHALIDIAIA